MTAVVLLCVLAASTCLGLVWRHRNGRIREVRGARNVADPPPDTSTERPEDRAGGGAGGGAGGRSASVDPAVLNSLGVRPGEAPVTLVQFSSAFCQPCRATRRVLGQVTDLLPEVVHVEVDAESHLAEVRALGILRTPTVLVLDRHGRVVRRASGLPRKAEVVAAVAPFLDAS